MQEANTGIPDSRREGAEQAHKTGSPLWKKLLIIFSGRKGEPAETPPTQTREEATWVYTFDAIFPNTE